MNSIMMMTKQSSTTYDNYHTPSTHNHRYYYCYDHMMIAFVVIITIILILTPSSPLSSSSSFLFCDGFHLNHIIDNKSLVNYQRHNLPTTQSSLLSLPFQSRSRNPVRWNDVFLTKRQHDNHHSIPLHTSNNIAIPSFDSSSIDNDRSSSISSVSSISISTDNSKSITTNLIINDEDDGIKDQQKAGTMIFLISSSYSIQPQTSKFGTSSPYGNPSIYEAIQQLQYKISLWSKELIDIQYYMIDDNSNELLLRNASTMKSLMEADVLISIGLKTKSEINFASMIYQKRKNRNVVLRRRQCQFAIDCNDNNNNEISLLPSFVSIYEPNNKFHELYANVIPWNLMGTSYRMYKQMNTLLTKRTTSDDFCSAILIFFHQYSGYDIDWVKYSIDATYEKGIIRNIKEIYNMFTKCNECIVECIQDDTCRQCITELTKIDSRDQVTSYRTIVSYESTLLKDFSLCIFTKHNIFECDASILYIPDIKPITTFRNMDITEEMARSLLVGHLNHPIALEGTQNLENISWMVACGANVAYDQFPSQHQLFYPAPKGRDMWYDPVFLVQTIDHDNNKDSNDSNNERYVWCHRHYKVRPQQTLPGTFRFSTSDNGVTSDEYWTIIDVADDLSWIIFHYTGAAKHVGLQYIGGLLCTPNGNMPPTSELDRIWSSFRKAGIQPWELYQVNNNRYDNPNVLKAGEPPLDIYYKKYTNV